MAYLLYLRVGCPLSKLIILDSAWKEGGNLVNFGKGTSASPTSGLPRSMFLPNCRPLVYGCVCVMEAILLGIPCSVEDGR